MCLLLVALVDFFVVVVVGNVLHRGMMVMVKNSTFNINKSSLLQVKVFWLILISFLLYGGLVCFGLYTFVAPSFRSLEKEEAFKNMDRVLYTIERELNYLDVSAVDWASWDDTYKFSYDSNNEYRKENLNVDVVQNLKVNIFAISNAKREMLWLSVYDLETKRELDLPDFKNQLVSSPSFNLSDPQSGAKGLLVTPLGPALIAARPILTSNHEGPVRGTMLFGRLLNISDLANQARVNLKIGILDGGPLGAEEAAIVSELGAGGEALIRDSDEATHVYQLLPDMGGKPALLFHVEMSKSITSRGEKAIRFFLLSLLGAGLVVLTSMFIGLKRMVLSPLRMLTGHVVALGQSGNLSARFGGERKDEFGILAKEFDKMVEQLADARESLIDLSYQSGIAEMASGVLHNIGNAITPMNVKLCALKSEFRNAPVAEMNQAATELADPATAMDRRSELVQFVELAGMELAALVQRSGRDLDEVRNHVDHVQLILADQQRYSRAQRVIQPVALSRVVSDAVKLLPKNKSTSMLVEQDSSLEQIGKVKAARVALQEVVGNLLINAIESISRCERPLDAGWIRIHGFEVIEDMVPMAHLCIHDNGIGIPEENVTKIFERGFSTKFKGPGMGLHWSANTIASMGGQLYVESEGAGQGACFHLLIPLVQADMKARERST